MISPLKVHNRFTPKKLSVLLGSISTKDTKRIVKIQILEFGQFFFHFRLYNNMGPYGSKSFEQHL